MWTTEHTVLLGFRNFAQMGNTLDAATRWTSAKSDVMGRLEYTTVNELILNRIAEFTLNFSQQHPEESQVVFRKPMTWVSSQEVSRLVDYGYRFKFAVFYLVFVMLIIEPFEMLCSCSSPQNSSTLLSVIHKWLEYNDKCLATSVKSGNIILCWCRDFLMNKPMCIRLG